MDRRSINARVARSIASASAAAGLTLERVASATDVPLSRLVAHPASDALTAHDIVRIGGFLSLSPSVFVKGAA